MHFNDCLCILIDIARDGGEGGVPNPGHGVTAGEPPKDVYDARGHGSDLGEGFGRNGVGGCGGGCKLRTITH